MLYLRLQRPKIKEQLSAAAKCKALMLKHFNYTLVLSWHANSSLFLRLKYCVQ